MALISHNRSLSCPNLLQKSPDENPSEVDFNNWLVANLKALNLVYPSQAEKGVKLSERKLTPLLDPQLRTLANFIVDGTDGEIEEEEGYSFKAPPFTGNWIERSVFVHKVAPHQAVSFRVCKSNKTVNTALTIDVKTLEPEIVIDKKIAAGEFFAKNLEAIVQLAKHPNVLGYRAAIPYICQHGELRYRVYQSYFPFSLIDVLGSNALLPITPQFQIQCLDQIAKGLQHIHDQGYVHRDVKPDNVLTDGRGYFVLIDLDGVETEAKLLASKSPQYLGTKGYYPPAQLKQNRPQTKAWDSYAFAIMMDAIFAFSKVSSVNAYLKNVIKTINESGCYIQPIKMRNYIFSKLERVAAYQSALKELASEQAQSI